MNNNSRSDQLIKIRPIIPMAKLKENIRPAESFQNQTIRPIIKFQHDLLIAVFKHYLDRRKLVVASLPVEQPNEVIEKALSNDTTFKHKMIGIIIGQFTVSEYKAYCQQTSEFNKRITQIVIERLKTNISEL